MRQLEEAPEGSKPRYSRASVQTLQTNGYSRVHSILDDYHPAAIPLTSQEHSQESKQGRMKFFRMKRRHSRSTSSASSESVQAATMNFSAALEQLVRARASEDRSVAMNDIIDETISCYKGLQINDETTDSWGDSNHNGGFNASRDTLELLQGESQRNYDNENLNREGVQILKSSPPTLDGFRDESLHHPAFRTMSDSHQEQGLHNQHFTAQSPFLHVQTQTAPSRWSNLSDGSAYSDALSGDRNSSNSSQGSIPQSPRQGSNYSPRQVTSSFLPSAPGNEQHDERDRVQSMASSSYSSPEDDSPIVAPLSPSRRGTASTQSSSRLDSSPKSSTAPNTDPSLPARMPWPGSEQHRSFAPPLQTAQQRSDPVQNATIEQTKPLQPRYHYLPRVARDPPSAPSNPRRRTETYSVSAALAGATASGTAPATAGLRHASWSSSTSSNVSGSLGILPGRTMKSEYMISPPVGKEKMMDGRPCKDNNYWGFCRGAWAVREGSKKGIKLKTLPSGVYNMKKVWECSTCTFQGDAFTIPHPTKKNDTQIVVDQRIHISMSGIRYRWIFLAKSHVRKKPTDNINEECNYCCLICSIEGTLSSVYGGVETLMNHIALTHIADMSKTTQEKAKCILGRTAGANEAFDINVPIFAPVEELPGLEGE